MFMDTVLCPKDKMSKMGNGRGSHSTGESHEKSPKSDKNGKRMDPATGELLVKSATK